MSLTTVYFVRQVGRRGSAFAQRHLNAHARQVRGLS